MFAQSTFRSNVASGDWDNPASWIEDVPGTDPDGIPDTNDDVFVQVGHNINIPDGTDQRVSNLDISRGTITFLGASGFLRVSGAFTAHSTAATQSTIIGTNLDHRFIVTSSGTFSVSSGSHLELDGVRLTCQGPMSLTGLLEFSTGVSSTHSIAGLTINSGGTFTNNTTDNFNIDGNLVNNSFNTFTASSSPTGSLYTFIAASSTISGVGTTTFSRLRVNLPNVLTNNGNVVMDDDIIGSGTFVNGATGNLSLNTSGALTITTLTLSTAGNVVRYIGGTNENMIAGPYYDLVIDMDDATIICRVNGNDVTVNNDLTIEQGNTRVQSANTLTVSGNVLMNDGEFESNNSEGVIDVVGNFTMAGGTFDFNDGDLNITGDLILSGGTMTFNEGTTPVNPATIDATDMTISGADVTLSEGTLTLSNASGGLTISSGSLLTNNAAHSLDIAGGFDLSGGSADMNAGTIDFVNMDITGGAAINVSNTVITSTGTITVTSGNFIVDGAAGTYNFNNIDVEASGIWDVQAAYDPTINGNLNNDGTFVGCNSDTGCDHTLTSATGTITGIGAMTAMSDIILNDGASYTNTNSGGFHITDRLATDSGTGSFINGANGYLLYGGSNGNFTVTNFTASATGNTVEYNRTTTNQLIQPTTDANNDYYNLVINKADGFDATTNAVITINNQLTMTLGDIIMGGTDIILAPGATIVGGNASSYIQENGGGNLVRSYSAGGDPTTLNLPIGDADVYAPMTFSLNSATVPGDATIEFQFDRDNPNGHPNKDASNTGSLGDDDGTAASAFIFGWWTFSIGGSITDINFSATLDYTNVGFSGTESEMVPVIQRTATPPGGSSTTDWFEVGSSPSYGSGNVNPTTNVITMTNVHNVENSSSTWVLYAMDNNLDRLPVELLSFEGAVKSSSILLTWITASEENNSYFAIERSHDGVHFTEIGSVEGMGTTNSENHYQFEDIFPFTGRSYYRLKQVDFNGQYEYSSVISVVWDGSNFTMISADPTLLRRGEMMKIKVYDRQFPTYEWKVFDTSGTSLISGSNSGSNNSEISTSQLSSGIYLVKVKLRNGEVWTRKFIVR